MNQFYNKDIMDWEKFPEYDVIWCDPPWEQKMVKFFETMMLKNGQQKPQNTIENIISKLADLSIKDKPIFIEYSVKGFELIIELMTLKGHRFCEKVCSFQENGNPYLILVFNSEEYSPDGTKKGFEIINQTCKDLSFKVVFDPFAGIGKTAKAFVKNGKTYIGSEINKERFNKLKKVLWQEQ